MTFQQLNPTNDPALREALLEVTQKAISLEALLQARSEEPGVSLKDRKNLLDSAQATWDIADMLLK
jgi:hypothetical protein